MAVIRDSGIAIATATPVTKRVPIIKGKKPNSPFRGCQDDEKSSSVKGFIDNTGLDLRYNPKAIKNTIRLEKIVNRSINLRASLFFNNLLLLILAINFHVK